MVGGGAVGLKRLLILEDGTVFEGKAFGAEGNVVGEVVFTTGMTGYQEAITDQSFNGQMITFTYPLVGNYGVNRDDYESIAPTCKGVIVKEHARVASNWRQQMTLDEFLKRKGIPGISGIDTRHLTRILREYGVMNGMITTNENYNLDEVLPKMKEYKVAGVVRKVTCKEKYVLNGDGPRVALMDFGAKKNIAKSLNDRGCEVTVYPAYTKAEEILASNPDGIMLSNGPGDPKECVEIIEEIKKLYASNVPIFAICLGHQLMSLATGADTHRLKYGHRGANHPVKDLATGKVYISTQNHGYVVDEATLNPEVAEPAFENVNDKTNEGLSYKGKNIFTVQFHPEACAGPQDTAYLFDRFMDMMKKED